MVACSLVFMVALRGAEAGVGSVMVFTGVETGAGAADGVEVVGFAGSALGFCGVFGALAGFHIFRSSSSQMSGSPLEALAAISFWG
jgi:hypothetical protein